MDKKIVLAVTLLLAAGATTSFAKKKDKNKKAEAACTLPKTDMKSRVDSVSYAMGVAQSNGLKNYVIERLKVDTTYYADFITGLIEGTKAKTSKEQAYSAGLQIGDQLTNQIFPNVNNDIYKDGDSLHTLNKALLIEGFITAVKEDSIRIPGGMDAAQGYLNTNVQILKDAYMAEKYGPTKKIGEDFLAANKMKDSIQTTPSGLQYKVLTMGTGEKPKETDRVKVNYRGTLIDGTEFDSSYKRNEPLTINANRVIKGWTEALTMMPVGSKWMLYIPQELGYGSREAGNIPPYSTLIFEVELLSIDNPAATPAQPTTIPATTIAPAANKKATTAPQAPAIKKAAPKAKK